MPPRLNRSHESVFAGKEPVTTHNDVAIYVTSDGRFGAELPTGDTDFAGKLITKPIYKRTMAELKRAIGDAAGLLTPLRIMVLTHGHWLGMRPAMVGTLTKVSGNKMQVCADGSGQERMYDNDDGLLLFNPTLATEWALLHQQYTNLLASADRLVSQATKLSANSVREIAALQRACNTEQIGRAHV